MHVGLHCVSSLEELGEIVTENIWNEEPNWKIQI